MSVQRHRSPQTKEISITSDSPPDVGRPLVPPEDLDRVDGIRPSSSRTRAVALLPAIEESLEEGPDSLQVEASRTESKHGGRRTSTKPLLTSISEERIPRLWEYPAGEISTEKNRPSGHTLGAGEASTLQLQQDQLSPVMSDKNFEGDVALVEAGDAEAREGNRSNHALGEPNADPDEVQQQQNILLTAIGSDQSGDANGEPELETREGAHAIEQSTNSTGMSVEGKSYADSEKVRMDFNDGVQISFQPTSLYFTEEINTVLSEESKREINNEKHFFLSQEEGLCHKELQSNSKSVQTSMIHSLENHLADSIQTTDEETKEETHLEKFVKEENIIDLSIRPVSDSGKNDTYLNEEIGEWKMIPSVEQVLDKGENVPLHSKAISNMHKLVFFEIGKSGNSEKSALCLNANLEKVKSKSAFEMKMDVSKDSHDQDSVCSVHSKEQTYGNLSLEKQRLPPFLCLGGYELCRNEEQILTEAIVKEIKSQEDSIVCSSGSSRAKGSGSDSMVADGNLSVADVAGARESHSDHTSCSEKTDQSAKTKDGSTKSRGRERERNKRKRADREDRGGSPADKQKLLKNAVGDVQVGLDETREVDAENTIQVANTTPLHDIVGREDRVIRAARSGDIRDNAVKSTCGLESQTVTSLDDSSDDTTESSSLWQQEQAREDSSSFIQSLTPPKGVVTSRFGKRTQLNRQKQTSPQEQDLIPQETEKVNVNIRVLGLGDSCPALSAAQDRGHNIGQNESCNNPSDPFTTRDNSDSCLQDEPEVRVEETHLVCSESHAADNSEEQNTLNIDNRQTNPIKTLTYKSTRDHSESLLNCINDCAKCEDEQTCVENSNLPKDDLIETDVGNALEFDKSGEFQTQDKENTKKETNFFISNNASNSIVNESHSKELNILCESKVCRSASTAGNGAKCCHHSESLDHCPTFETVTNSGEQPEANSSSDTSVATSMTGASSKAGKSSQAVPKKRLSNFASLFPPTTCTGDLCYKSRVDTPTDLKENVFHDTSSKSHPSSFLEVNQRTSQSDFSETSDFCNPLAAHESGAQTLILSEDLPLLNHHNLVDLQVPKETEIDSRTDSSLQTSEQYEFTSKLLQEEQTLKKNSTKEFIFPEGLHIPHVDGESDQISLICALAEAAEDCSPPGVKFDSVQDCIPSPIANKMNEKSGVTELASAFSDEFQSVNMCKDAYCSEISRSKEFNISAECSESFSSSDSKRLEMEAHDIQVEKTKTVGVVSVIEPTKTTKDKLLEVSMESEPDSIFPDAENLQGAENIEQMPNYEMHKHFYSKSNQIYFAEERAKSQNQQHEAENVATDKIDIEGQGLNGIDSLNKGDYPVALKIRDNAELCKKVCDIDHKYVEAEEKMPNLENQVLTAVQSAAAFSSPHPQRRSNTPVAGDGDCMEKEDSETIVKLEQSDFMGESENKDSGFTFFREDKVEEQADNCVKLTSSEHEIITDIDDSVENELEVEVTALENCSNKSEQTPYQTRHYVEDARDTICFFENNLSSNIGFSEKSNFESNCRLQLPPRTTSETLSTKTESTVESNKPQLEVYSDQENRGSVVVENAQPALSVHHENDAGAVLENNINSLQNKNITTEKDSVWADMVIREVDRVCEDYHQKQPERHVSDHFMSLYRNEHPTLEELALETSLGLGHGNDRRFKKSLTEDALEDGKEIFGRSKDGGKRAKRSKPYSNLESDAIARHHLVSENHVRRITLVDVEDFPKDKPCVYHPDTKCEVKKREREVTHSRNTRHRETRRKRVTLWNRLKTIFHPRRFVSKERKERGEKERIKIESIPQKVQAIGSKQVPALLLRQPAKSDNTLDVPQGELGRDPPTRTAESWPNSNHKVKARPSGQWRRLKKFRALRYSAERQGGRLPATMRQVVSKSNYVREAEGDHPATGRQDANYIPHSKRKSSSDVPLLKESHRSSRSTPEVAQVLKMDEHLTDFHFNPGQPNVRSLVESDTEVTYPNEYDDLLSHLTVNKKEQFLRSRSCQLKNKEEESKSRRSASQKWERGVSDNILSLHKGSKRANTYCPTASQISNAKTKANTHPCCGKNQSLINSNESTRPNKNCRLM